MTINFRSVLDIVFLAGVVFALFLGDKVVPLFIVFGMLPIPFLWKVGDYRGLAATWARLAIPAAAYLGYSLLVYFFYTGLSASEALPVNPDFQFYLIAIAMLAVGLVRGLQIRDFGKLFQLVLPWSLLISVAVLTVMMFLGVRDDCRVRGFAAWPFIPALLFTTLTFLSLLGWKDLSSRARLLRLVLIAFSILVVTGYTGSRGVAVGQFAVLGLFFLLSLLPRFRGLLPNWSSLIAAIVGGMILCGVVGLATGCGAGDRLVLILRSVTAMSAAHPDLPAPSTSSGQPANPASATNQDIQDKTIMATVPDVSIGQRLEMWATSVKSIREAPFFGHGSLYLQHLITERYGFEHNHNQYLSWLVTGGLLVLVLGLWFLAVPWLITAGLAPVDRVVITLSVTVFWGATMMFDSYFNLDFYFHYFCLLLGLLFAFVNDRLKTQTAAAAVS